MSPDLPPSARHRWIATRAIDTAWVGTIVILFLATIGEESATGVAPLFACSLAAYGVYLYMPAHFIGDNYFEIGGLWAVLFAHVTAATTAIAGGLLVSTVNPTLQLATMVTFLIAAGGMRKTVDPLLEPHEHI